jgi:hypothetical protein
MFQLPRCIRSAGVLRTISPSFSPKFVLGRVSPSFSTSSSSNKKVPFARTYYTTPGDTPVQNPEEALTLLRKGNKVWFHTRTDFLIIQ